MSHLTEKEIQERVEKAKLDYIKVKEAEEPKTAFALNWEENVKNEVLAQIESEEKKEEKKQAVAAKKK